MPAYKRHAKIDSFGQLIITEPINLPPGEVEVIILQPVTIKIDSPSEATVSPHEIPPKKLKSGVKSLKELLENAPPIPPDFDPSQARWEALKEKYDL
ncbi:conserved hypothetical protein (plasmid) [Gloeothece citriformis PCC 7424]|uniref:Uncharacterized protein n=1 Tax=Gloeothece citriformis (strain PCC 7424) TaxID=65393 RepID=B7KMU7_GLOC7|nr:hypothetical protein [Gloeothece citriformis]ACK74119.1 conserved hypothetical protein [Gloeothece citriformis PCC 7424]